MKQSGIYKLAKKNPLAVIGIVTCVIWLIAAIIAPLIAPYGPFTQDLPMRYDSPSTEHIMGTDHLGRDVFSRVIWGARISIPAGVIVIVISTLFGGLYGAIAGYMGKLTDEAMMRVADVVMSFPPIILAMAIAAALGPSIMNAVFAIVIVWWPRYARMMRGLVLSTKEAEYVSSAVALGEKKAYVLLKTIVPNCVAPLLVMASVDLGNAILIFSGLGFLGLGVAPPAAEWGVMVAQGVAIFQYWWISFFPGVAILTVAMGFNFIGDAFRDMLDPRLRRQI